MNRKIFLSYVKKQLRIIVVLLFFLLVFSVVFYFYALPIEPVAYAALLCCVLGLIYFVLDFVLFREKCLLLYDIKGKISHGISNLPKADNAIEAAFLEFIHSLYEENRSLEYEADKSRDELMDYYTLWAHQIKVPLTALRLLVQTSGMENKEIISELFKIEQYVGMVLQYLRVDSMSSDLVFEKYSLDEIAKQAIRNYSTLFIGNDIRLEISELDCQGLTDKKWLGFVIEQILSNSLKYTRAGGAISMYMNKGKILVIEDTGIGISPENLGQVFRRGFTGYNGRLNSKSTGLGLYLCKEILDKLSHSIEVQSRPDAGTRVLLGLGSLDITIE